MTLPRNWPPVLELFNSIRNTFIGPKSTLNYLNFIDCTLRKECKNAYLQKGSSEDINTQVCP